MDMNRKWKVNLKHKGVWIFTKEIIFTPQTQEAGRWWDLLSGWGGFRYVWAKKLSCDRHHPCHYLSLSRKLICRDVFRFTWAHCCALLSFYVFWGDGEVYEQYRRLNTNGRYLLVGRLTISPEHELQQIGRFYSKHLSEGLWQLGEQWQWRCVQKVCIRSWNHLRERLKGGQEDCYVGQTF